MDFKENIKEWVEIDNEIRLLNDKVKSLRSRRKNITTNINEYVSTNKLENAIVNISDGRIRFVQSKQIQPLTFTLIQKCLLECIEDTNKVGEIMNHIKKSREYKFSPDIKRTFNK